MSEIESKLILNDSGLRAEKELTSEELKVLEVEKQVEKPELSPEELSRNIEKRKQQDVKQIEVIQKELKEMQLAGAEIESSQIAKTQPVDINRCKRFLAKYEGLPFMLISTKRLNGMKRDIKNRNLWMVSENDIATRKSEIATIESELEKRGSKDPVTRTFLSFCRFMGRALFNIWDEIRSIIKGIASIHFEERSPEDKRRIINELKKNPYFRRIAEEEEREIWR